MHLEQWEVRKRQLKFKKKTDRKHTNNCPKNVTSTSIGISMISKNQYQYPQYSIFLGA